MRLSIVPVVRIACVLCLLTAGTSNATFWITAEGDTVGESEAPGSSQVRLDGQASALAGSASSLVSPSVNLAVTTQPDDQRVPTGTPDGAGGMIITWEDSRDLAVTGLDIYAHHILACGQLDPTWPVGGVAITRAPGDDRFPVICTDGTGGAFIVWTEQFSLPASADVFAQHLLANGTLDPAWPMNGLGVCTAPGRQLLPRITSDGTSGAYVVWDDLRAGRFAFAHHLLTSGVDPAWTVNGNPVCPSVPSNQSFPVVCSDGSGGMIVAWGDSRTNPVTARDIFAQRMSATGALLWAPSGVPVCTAPGSQLLNGVTNSALFIVTHGDGQSNAIVPDGAGGCLITWFDGRFPPSDGDIFAQRITAGGSVAAGWPANGVALCTAAGVQNGPVLITDGTGGAYGTWNDEARPAPFVQRVTGAGVPTGPVDGLAMSGAGFGGFTPVGVSDGAGGAIFFWSDARNIGTSDDDIFAQHVVATSTVALDAGWPADGVTVSNAMGAQFIGGSGGVVQHGSGGAIAAWEDGRDLSTNGVDIYAQSVLATGVPGWSAPVASITGPPTGSVFPVNSVVTFAGSFTDADPDVHTARWEFDALPPVAGVVNEGQKTVTADYTFTTPGVYAVRLTVTDGCGESSTSTQVNGFDALVVIYDPSAGFVTGGGWIDSPAGAYAADPLLVGKANFGFLARYEKGATTPTGSTEFQFKAADFSFSSSSYEWLVVSGAKAQYRGLGTINGAGAYRFKLTAMDGKLSGGEPDRLRMRITEASTDALVYDNQLSAPDDADPTTVLGGGSVVIHRDKGGSAALEPADPAAGPAGEPERFALSSCGPNPFVLESTMCFRLPERSRVAIELLDIAGRRVQSILNAERPAGEHEIRIAARDGTGGALSPGLYFVRLETQALGSGARFTGTRRLIRAR